MGLSVEEKKRFLKALEEDEEFRLAVAGLLGLREVLEEIRKLREDFNRYIAESEKRWEENEKRWEENERRWQENEKRWEENWRRWEENERRWEENWRRWEENERRWQENERRWQENFRRWEENERRWQEAFNEFRWLRAALTEIRDALGGGFEYYSARVVSLMLRERGVECDVRVNVTLPVDGFKEVDLICYEPLVVGEVSVAARTMEEAIGLLEQLRRSVEAAEKFTNRKTYLKVLSVEFAPADIAEYLQKAAEAEGIYLILGRKY
ncbi:MAG: hypothetical protein QXP98_06960 [Thermoproteus sp.]